MLCEVYDNIFSRDFMIDLDNLIKNIPMESSNITNVQFTRDKGVIGNHRLFGMTIFRRTGMNRITKLHEKADLFFDMFEKIQAYLNRKYYLEGIDINLQHSGCDGTTHVDGESEHERTIMLMSSCYWEPEWGGKFQLTNEDGTDIIEEYDYVPGRVLVIPSNHPHRGLGPNIQYPYVYRTTVVFRTEPLRF